CKIWGRGREIHFGGQPLSQKHSVCQFYRFGVCLLPWIFFKPGYLGGTWSIGIDFRALCNSLFAPQQKSKELGRPKNIYSCIGLGRCHRALANNSGRQGYVMGCWGRNTATVYFGIGTSYALRDPGPKI